MKTTVLTTEKILALGVADLRKRATEMGIKNVSKFKKEQLQAKVIDLIIVSEKKEKKVEVKTEKAVEKQGVSKSQLLRQEIKNALKKGLSIDSGSLMKTMEEKHEIKMHRSFVITVRNKFKQILTPAS